MGSKVIVIVAASLVPSVVSIRNGGALAHTSTRKGPTEVDALIGDYSKVKNELGWEPHVELDDGLARTIAWYRERALARA